LLLVLCFVLLTHNFCSPRTAKYSLEPRCSLLSCRTVLPRWSRVRRGSTPARPSPSFARKLWSTQWQECCLGRCLTLHCFFIQTAPFGCFESNYRIQRLLSRGWTSSVCTLQSQRLRRCWLRAVGWRLGWSESGFWGSTSYNLNPF